MSEQKAEYVVAPFEPGETVYELGETVYEWDHGKCVIIDHPTILGAWALSCDSGWTPLVTDRISRTPWDPRLTLDAHRDHVAKREAVVAAARTAADMIDKRRWKHTTAAADECVEMARTVLVKALDALEGK
jgi:hypothetical protein